MSYRPSRAEQEVHIWWDAADPTAHVYTASNAIMRKLDKLCTDYPEVFKCTRTDTVSGETISKEYYFDAKYIRFAKPASAKQKEAALKNLGRTEKPA